MIGSIAAIIKAPHLSVYYCDQEGLLGPQAE